jgi:hypothetical protein
LYKGVFLDTYFFKKDFFTDTFTERGFYTQLLLDQDASVTRYSYMGEAGNAIWGRVQAIWESSFHPCCFFRDAFTYTGFYTGRGLHTEMVLSREMILQRDASSYRCSYTEILSTQRCFCTPAL